MNVSFCANIPSWDYDAPHAYLAQAQAAIDRKTMEQVQREAHGAIVPQREKDRIKGAQERVDTVRRVLNKDKDKKD